MLGGFNWLNELLLPEFGDTLWLSLVYFGVLFFASDFMGIPNLREKSNEILTRAYNSIFDKSKITLRGKKDYALLLYGLSSWIFIIGIVSWMVLYHSDSIMHFPLTIAESIKTIYSNFNFQVLTLQLSELIVPTIFYFIMIRLVVKIIRNQEFQFPSKPSKYV